MCPICQRTNQKGLGPQPQWEVTSFQSLPLDQPVHPFQIGDQVLVRKWKRDPLTPRWDGPHTVSLISHAAVKLLGSDKWTHHTRVKRFITPDEGTPEVDTSPLSTPEVTTGDEFKNSRDSQEGRAIHVTAAKSRGRPERTELECWDISGG
uniref:Murine leukemia virus integrase C-terminal domain-containing protein n=1 Tax=Pelusios castaneus TaxID=367368 RepID=A0A8C8RPW4_9SAUR